MAALQTKHWLFHCLKKEVLVSEPSLVNRKRSLLFEISRYFFASHEVWFVIIVIQYGLSYIIINL